MINPYFSENLNLLYVLDESLRNKLRNKSEKIPSIIIYKMGTINFFIVKMLVKVKFANIVNIAAGKEIIPELLQSKCNAKNIFNTVVELLNDEKILKEQINKSQKIINNFKTNKSSEIATSVLINSL